MSSSTTRFPAGLYALALGGFGIGLTEFGVVGLLPPISAEFGVSAALSGVLVSGYAISVAVGAILLTALLARFERRGVLLGLVVLFVLGNLLSALAPDFSILLLGRLIAALCHGAFFGVGAVVAADLVPVQRRASAIALMFTGLTVANVLGVPFGTFLGQSFGWRSTFWALTVIGILTLVGIRLLVRHTPAPHSERGILAGLRTLGRPVILVSALVSIFTFGGLVGAYTYIAFTLTQVSGLPEASLPWMLLLFGLGSFIGNLIGGRLADRALNRSLPIILALLTLLLAGFAASATIWWVAPIALFALGVIGFASAPGLQVRIMQLAPDAPTAASGANIAALNIGNAIGAAIGGALLAAGFGATAPVWTGSALALLALITLVSATAFARRRLTP
ncbi:MFS transporter [Mycetocola saprophilus]|uniref:MFS transporter n=1 Tax=Mycetocola saprophilus TaxID=76636 RepID=UPI0004BF927C|nr:MFS transporter [Mycetocola saprophilus]